MVIRLTAPSFDIEHIKDQTRSHDAKRAAQYKRNYQKTMQTIYTRTLSGGLSK